MTDAQITTVIPTYRRPELLKRAIESVLGQSYRAVLVHVYDNNSQDETESVVRDFMRRDARVAYFGRRENIGPCANMARGVDDVSSPFYSLLNDDDFLLPGFYEGAICQLSRYPRAMFACAPAISLDLIRGRMQRRNTNWTAGFHESSKEVCSRMFHSHFAQPGVVLRREMSSLIGPFEVSGDDRLYMTIAAGCRPFVTLSAPGAVFMVHENSYSSTVGLRGAPAAEVYEQFLSTLQTVLSTDIEGRRKVELVLLIFRAYCSTFETRAIAELLSHSAMNQEFSGLPLRTSRSAIVRDVLRFVPRTLQRPVAALIGGLQKYRMTLERKSPSWRPLPENIRMSVAAGMNPRELSSLLARAFT